MVNFWETKEWIELKTTDQKTDRVLSRVEYVRAFGWVNYSPEKYKQYLEAMKEKELEDE